MFTSGRDNFLSDQGPTKEVIHASATQLTPTSLGHLSISSQRDPAPMFAIVSEINQKCDIEIQAEKS